MTRHYFELLRFYRRAVALIFIGVVGGVVLFSVSFLFISPVYTGTAKVSLLPTDSELAFSQSFVRGASINPANLMSQTHIEYLLSRELSQETVDRLIAELGTPVASNAGGIKAELARGFKIIKNSIRMAYNILNSGKHVPLDPYTDTILTLQDSIAAEMIEGTYILEIAVSWDSPEVAAKAANLLADVYVERAREQAVEAALELEQELLAQMAQEPAAVPDLEHQIEALRMARAAGFNVLRVIDAAVPPIYPSFPKVVINTLLAIAGAFAISIFVLVTADTFSGTLKTRTDLERLLPASSFPSLSQKGKPQKQVLDEIARLIRLRNDIAIDRGAVISMIADQDADRVADILRQILRTDRPWAVQQEQQVNKPLLLVAGGQDQGGGTLAAIPAPRQEGDRPTHRISVTLGANGGVESFGGATSGYIAGQPAPDWLVVVVPQGQISDAEFQRIVRAWSDRGVLQIYGVVLTG